MRTADRNENKRHLICLAIILLFCNFVFAEVHISDGKMTVNITNERLDKVLSLLRKQTDIEFYIDDTVSNQTICADFQNLSIGRGIKKLLEGTGVNYAVIAKNGKTDAIFIGSSQKPQVSSAKLDARPTTNWRNQTIYRSPNTLQPAHNANKASPELGNQKQSNQENPVATIPTGGTLDASPNPKRKNQEE